MNTSPSWPARAGRTSHTAAVLIAVAGLLAACQAAGDPSPRPPTPTPVPTPVAEWATFESKRYGYAIDHPADWEVHEKVGTAAFSILKPYAPGADFITSPDFYEVQTRHGVQVAAMEVDFGTDLLDMTNQVHQPCGGPSKHDEITVDGEPALLRKFTCNSNRPVYLQVTAIHDGRGYVVWLMTSERPNADKRPDYLTMIDSFHFTDATAAGGG